MAWIDVLRVGPGVTVQDMGRPGYLAQGLSRGGAMDRNAIIEGAVLLGQDTRLAALEIAGSYVSVQATVPLRVAFTGAPMRALCDGAPLGWNASHAVPDGARLDLSGSQGGYSYLHVGGGIDAPHVLGARSAHLAAGIGQMVTVGDRMPFGGDDGGRVNMFLPADDRFYGGVLRIVDTPQTRLFPDALRKRFLETEFRKDARGNRIGQRLVSAGDDFALQAGLHLLSEVVVPGDIQITGDGVPFVLLAECQTTGGYPRIGTVLPSDLPCLLQAPAGAALRFQRVSIEEGREIEQAEAVRLAALHKALQPLHRDPQSIRDLLSYQLISGVTVGDDLERGKE